jgi:hypothetical protein
MRRPCVVSHELGGRITRWYMCRGLISTPFLVVAFRGTVLGTITASSPSSNLAFLLFFLPFLALVGVLHGHAGHRHSTNDVSKDWMVVFFHSNKGCRTGQAVPRALPGQGARARRTGPPCSPLGRYALLLLLSALVLLRAALGGACGLVGRRCRDSCAFTLRPVGRLGGCCCPHDGWSGAAPHSVCAGCAFKEDRHGRRAPGAHPAHACHIHTRIPKVHCSPLHQ